MNISSIEIFVYCVYFFYFFMKIVHVIHSEIVKLGLKMYEKLIKKILK